MIRKSPNKSILPLVTNLLDSRMFTRISRRRLKPQRRLLKNKRRLPRNFTVKLVEDPRLKQNWLTRSLESILRRRKMPLLLKKNHRRRALKEPVHQSFNLPSRAKTKLNLSFRKCSRTFWSPIPRSKKIILKDSIWTTKKRLKKMTSLRWE